MTSCDDVRRVCLEAAKFRELFILRLQRAWQENDASTFLNRQSWRWHRYKLASEFSRQERYAAPWFPRVSFMREAARLAHSWKIKIDAMEKDSRLAARILPILEPGEPFVGGIPAGEELACCVAIVYDEETDNGIHRSLLGSGVVVGERIITVEHVVEGKTKELIGVTDADCVWSSSFAVKLKKKPKLIETADGLEKLAELTLKVGAEGFSFKPASLAESALVEAQGDQTVTAVGYGLCREPRTEHGVRLQGRLKAESRIGKNMLTAYSADHSVCDGDSGGGLFARNENDEWKLLGFTSKKLSDDCLHGGRFLRADRLI